jgi:hypothetical protein
MADTIGDDRQTMDTIVGNYRAKFPEPEPDEEPEPADEGNQRKLGAIEEQAGEPAPQPRPARRPAAADDQDDDFGQSFMTRG